MPSARSAVEIVHQHADAVGLDLDLVLLARRQAERGLKRASIDSFSSLPGARWMYSRMRAAAASERCTVGNLALRRLQAELLVQLAGGVELGDDVAAADELALQVELRDRRPRRVFLDAVADVGIGEHVDRRVVLHQAVEDLHDLAGEAALRHRRGCPS